MASGFFVLGARGEPLIQKIYRGDITASSVSTAFTNRVVDSVDDASMPPPVFQHDDVTYLWLSGDGVYLVVTTRLNTSISSLSIFLSQIFQLLVELYGTVSEDAIRSNFVSLYEVLDEAMDFGYPVCTDLTTIKPLLSLEHNRFTAAVQAVAGATGAVSTNPVSDLSETAGGTQWRPAGIKHRQNSVFLDVVETIHATLTARGEVVSCDIVGALMLKCRLSSV